MAEKVPLEKSKGFATGKPETVISTSASDFSVAFTGPDGIERWNFYPDDAPSDLVAINTAADLCVPPTKNYQDKFIERLDSIKADPYCKETKIEFKAIELGWPPTIGSLTITVKKGLRQAIKYFKKKEGE